FIELALRGAKAADLGAGFLLSLVVLCMAFGMGVWIGIHLTFKRAKQRKNPGAGRSLKPHQKKTDFKTLRFVLYSSILLSSASVAYILFSVGMDAASIVKLALSSQGNELKDEVYGNGG